MPWPGRYEDAMHPTADQDRTLATLVEQGRLTAGQAAEVRTALWGAIAVLRLIVTRRSYPAFSRNVASTAAQPRATVDCSWSYWQMTCTR